MGQANHTYYNLSSTRKMSGRKYIPGFVDRGKKQGTSNLVWRPVSTQANSIEGLIISLVIFLKTEDI